MERCDFFMVKVVKKGLVLELLPDDEMAGILEQNIGNARFIWNQLLSQYNRLRKQFQFHGYPLNANIRNFNMMLNMLKVEYPFLREGESTSQQQVFRDQVQAFNMFFKQGHGYPKFKSRRNPKQSFRIQKNGNNIRVTNKRIRLAKLGYVHYHASKEYRQILKNSKINNVTVKRENGKYYAVVNITTNIEELEKTGENIGIDLGFKKLATLSNGEEIEQLDIKKEEEMIKKYQKKLSRKEYMSENYKKTLKTYHKWLNKRNNKIKDRYHKISKKLVQNYDIISMENLNVKGMFQNKKWASKLQRINLYKLVWMIKYKAEWYGKQFIQIDRFYPSSQTCNICGYQYEDLTLEMRKWTCPACGKKHHRDINAAKNILKEGKKLIS